MPSGGSGEDCYLFGTGSKSAGFANERFQKKPPSNLALLEQVPLGIAGFAVASHEQAYRHHTEKNRSTAEAYKRKRKTFGRN